MRTVEEILSEVRHLAGSNLGEQELEETLLEVRAHLDASIQARLELGVPQQEAEEQAVIAFGDAKRFVSQISETRLQSRPWQRYLVAAFVGLATIFLTAPDNNLRYDQWYLFWTVLAFSAAIGVAALYGFRYARPRVQSFLAVLGVSFAISISTLSAIYIAEPGQGFASRSEVRIYARGPDMDSWIYVQQKELDKMVTDKLQAINASQPPYVIPRSVFASSETSKAMSREEARALLQRYKHRVEDNLVASKGVVAASTKAENELLDRPFFLNAMGMTTFALPNFAVTWIAAIFAFLFGSVVRMLGRQRFATQFLNRPILEIGMNEEALRMRPFQTDFSKNFPVLSRLARTEWIDKRVAIALVLTIVLTSIILPFAWAEQLFWGTLLLSAITLAALNWKVERPQFVTLFFAFLLGVPIYSYTSWLGNRAVHPRAHLHVTDGLSISGLLMFLALLVCTASWFAGSIVRKLRSTKVTTS